MKILITPNDNKGAILIISIIIGVVALAAGLTAANFVSRSTRNITDQESSVKALAIAESGVEKVLGVSDITSYVSDCPITPGTSADPSYIPTATHAGVVASPSSCFFQEDLNADSTPDQSYYLEITSKGGTDTYTQNELSKDTVLEINTDTLGAEEIIIHWGDNGDNVTPKYASILVTEVYYDGAEYKAKKYAFNPDPSHLDMGGQNSNGFDEASLENATVVLTGGTKIVRIKPIYFDATNITVTITGGNTFPTEDQGFDIYSTGCTCDNILLESSRQNSSVRKVKVTKSREHLPAIFDYVLYSGSESSPLTK